MTASSLDLSARADLEWLADLIGDAQQAVPSVEWLIIGALARDLHLSYARGIRIDRVTTDTDLALAINDWAEFADVRRWRGFWACCADERSRATAVDPKCLEFAMLDREGRAPERPPNLAVSSDVAAGNVHARQLCARAFAVLSI